MVAGSDRPNVDEQQRRLSRPFYPSSRGRAVPHPPGGRYIDDLGERPGTLKVQPTPLSMNCMPSVRYWTTIVVLRIPSCATSP